jgi:predicted DNA-binding protein (MmcQ/YjbR family)
MIDIEYFREYCLTKRGVEEGTPFGEDILVFKAGGKIFLLCSINEFNFVNMKCEPEYAIELRERYYGVTPGYHMSKKHWNSVSTDGSVPTELFYQLIDHSYEMILKSLPKKLREQFM